MVFGVGHNHVPLAVERNSGRISELTDGLAGAPEDPAQQRLVDLRLHEKRSTFLIFIKMSQYQVSQHSKHA